MTLEHGQVLGRYRLVERLGQGGFGECWRAEHTELGTQVTLKIALDPAYAELLRREGRILAQLEHEGIVRVIDIDPASDPPFVVAQYVAGRTLRDVISEGPTPPETALRQFDALLEILDHAHQRGVIHRDVKPENVLLGDDGRLHLLDFGLGRIEELAARELAVDHSLKSGQGVAGTVSYMSPEQRGGEPVDERADLYAAGIVLFELLTGRYPALNDRPGRGLPDGLGTRVDAYYGRLVAPLEDRCRSAAEARAALASLRTDDPQTAPEAVQDDADAVRPTAETGIEYRRESTGCGVFSGTWGLLTIGLGLALLSRGIGLARVLVILGGLMLPGFFLSRRVAWSWCPRCGARRRLESDEVTCSQCRQRVDSP